MPYSEYTSLSKLRQRLGVEHQALPWLSKVVIEPVAPSETLQADISLGLRLPLNTEKARSENLISPLLREVLRKHEDEISFFSGYGFNVDENLGLNGNCDFLLAGRPHLLDVESPVFCLVEAKNGVVDEAYAQCAAEMYAASIYNAQNADVPNQTIFGCATNGYEWVFLQLKSKLIFIDNQHISINNTAHLLGIFQYIISQSKY